MPTGIALAGLVAAAFADAGWRTIFAVDLVLLAAAVIVTVVAVPRDRQRSARRRRRPPAGALTASLPLAAAFFCFALLFLAVAGLLPAWLVERRGLAAADAGRIAAIATAFGIPGSLLAGSLMRAGVSAGRLAAIGLLGSMALAALCFTVLPLPLAVVGFALSFAIGGLVPAATFASVPLVAGQPARHRTDQRPGGAGRQPGLAGRAAAARRVGRLDQLAVRAAAAAHDRGAGRRRGARRQTRFSTTMNHVLPANGTSRPRKSTGKRLMVTLFFTLPPIACT